MENTSTELLIAKLKEIEACNEIAHDPEGLTNGAPDDPHLLVQEAVDLACMSLIDSRGGCAWAEHNKLKAAGYQVHCGERDSFGWLSGVIPTTKGDIVYW